jgi:hypothetical protein
MSKAHSLQRIKGGIVYMIFLMAYTVAVLLRPGSQDDVLPRPPLSPTPLTPTPPLLSHTPISPFNATDTSLQTVYLQNWLANQQLVSYFQHCDNSQKKGFLSIAKNGKCAGALPPPCPRPPTLTRLTRRRVDLAAGSAVEHHQRRFLLREAG